MALAEVSGRDKGFLESHFGAYESVTLIAEHGHPCDAYAESHLAREARILQTWP